MTTRGRILVVDDKDTMAGLWRRILEPDHEVVTAGDGAAAIAALGAGGAPFDVVVTDLRMPKADGFEVLAAVQRQSPGTEVVMVTAFGSVERAVEAMKGGAFDFLQKPFDPDEARRKVEAALEQRRARAPGSGAGGSEDGFGELAGRTPAARRLFELLEKAARTQLTVLLLGESGTGKELAARALHARGPRRAGPLVAVNCGALPSELMESELFGHARGAFSGADRDRPGLFEAAEGGTLFLDEISELPLPLQVKLNRALQDGEVRRVGETTPHRVDVRVIAASNVDLRGQVAAGRFREDLFFRLNVFPVSLPPLRDRLEDLPLLAGALLERQAARTGRRAPRLGGAALDAMRAHPWPGNVRELENVLQRAAALAEGQEILPEHLDLGGQTSAASPPATLSFKEAMDAAQEEAARRLLRTLLETHQGSVTRAAEAAGVARETLHRQLKRYGVNPDEFRK